MTDFFTDYFNYAGVNTSEPPAIFHRWACISMISALLGRQCFFPFGHSKIYPNQYIMIMGSPGTRKSSAINVATGLLKETGYSRFSSDKTSKERFLMDMKQLDDAPSDDEILDFSFDAPSESYVAIGEFTDFIGQGNMEFVTMLTNLWDCPPIYKNPKITGKSVEVPNPVVNILGGNTAQGFALAFPPEALGNGFLSRLIFVYGEPTNRKITFPKPPSPELKEALVDRIKEIKQKCVGVFTMTSDAEALLDRMYQEEILIEDHRFKHYATRRFTHLIKLCMAIAASRISMEITAQDALEANTILFNTEKTMPKALGEFGRSKYADVANLVIEILTPASMPLNANDIYKKVSQDVGKITDLADVLNNLTLAGKIQLMTTIGKTGYVLKQDKPKEWKADLILADYLHKDERN
jgi:hypothetical protein